jgi:lectin-like protein
MVLPSPSIAKNRTPLFRRPRGERRDLAHEASGTGTGTGLRENMAIVLPLRQRSHGRQARLAGGTASIGLVALMGCAGLLDLPSDPQLAEESASAPVGGKPASPPGSTEPAAVPTEPGDQTASPAVVSDPRGMGAPGPSDGNGSNEERAGLGAESADAGPREVDAAVPAEVPSNDPCAATESLGPDGLCYLVVTTALTWDDARQNCSEHAAGWALAAIHDATVNAFMSELEAGEAWVGASDAETEGTWVWIDDGVPFWQGTGDTGSVVGGAFETWNSDEPNGRGNSDCARLVPPPVTSSAGPTWADLECFELRGSVCSGPAR